MVSDTSRIALISLHEEQASAYLYAAMAKREDGEAARLFLRLGRASRRQADLWIERLEAAGIHAPPFRPRIPIVRDDAPGWPVAFPEPRPAG